MSEENKSSYHFSANPFCPKCQQRMVLQCLDSTPVYLCERCQHTEPVEREPNEIIRCGVCSGTLRVIDSYITLDLGRVCGSCAKALQETHETLKLFFSQCKSDF